MNSIQTSHHFQSDRRQIGGLLMILGFCAIIQPSADIVSGFGPEGANTTDPSTIPFWALVGGLCIFINGTVSVIVGYLATVHDWSHPYLNQFLMIILQTSWIPYITNMTAVGQGSRMPAEMNGFIPVAYDPTDSDVRFVGAMGVMSILSYGFALIGSMAFMVWSLHAYTTGKPEQRSGRYFPRRLAFYSGVLFVAGLAQFLLGVYTAIKFRAGALTEGPVQVAFLIVSYPIIAIVIGALELLNGLWGISCALGFAGGPGDNSFSKSLLIQWILVLTLQVVAQIGRLPDGMGAPAAPTVIAFSFGLTMLPAYLDLKMRTLPAEFPANYYDAVTSSDCEKGGKGGKGSMTHVSAGNSLDRANNYEGADVEASALSV